MWQDPCLYLVGNILTMHKYVHQTGYAFHLNFTHIKLQWKTDSDNFLPVQPQQIDSCVWVLRRGISSLHRAVGSFDQTWTDQDLRRVNPGCMPFYEAQQTQEHSCQRQLQEPTLPCVNMICFWWPGSQKSASSAPTLYKSGWTWWTSGPVNTEEEGGRSLGDLFRRSQPRGNREEEKQRMLDK